MRFSDVVVVVIFVVAVAVIIHTNIHNIVNNLFACIALLN